MNNLTRATVALTGFFVSMSAVAAESAQGRRIEEVVVTAEKREATVSDTSISITAFGEMMIEDFGLQDADDLVNFIPATTRDTYDIRIRGVGRNFRALGGDPGVATYYNGVYSEDFGIASTENGLYDIARVEVLRGPQGTLYGRNSIGGALNYITNPPTYAWEGELRAMFGNFGTQEYYGILSGPLLEDRLAARVVALKRDRDGFIDGEAGTEDIDTIDDQNVSVALNWRIADNWEANVRWNDRDSDRVIGQPVLVDQGTGPERGSIDGGSYAYGIRPATAATPGAIGFVHPVSGATLYGAGIRPGVDTAANHRPNSFFGVTTQTLDDLDDLDPHQATNDSNDEEFLHNAVHADLSWDISETTQLKYIGGWSAFDYTYDIDLDASNGTLSQYRSTVLEDVETVSHELQLLWQIGDRLQMTSGLYYFNSDRLQNFAFKDLAAQGRYTQPAVYGNMAGLVAFASPTSHTRLGDVAVFESGFGLWEGDPTGAYYEYANTVDTDAYAAYTQGTYTFNEQWALTLGLRYAKDEKTAGENRTGYFEEQLNNPSNFLNYAYPFFEQFCVDTFGGFGATSCADVGLTPLAVGNIFMGNAIPTGDPSNPIVPTCAPIDDPACATPLRLTGVPFSFADRTEGKEEWSDVTYRVNVDWTPNDETLVYFSVTTGYRAGGFSLGIGDSRGPNADGVVVPAVYDKEEIVAYEIGYKGTFLDDRLQLNTSVYHYDFDNYQDRVELFNLGSNTATDVVQNVDKAENRGVEFEVTWLPTESWTIGGNGSYADTEYKSDFFVLEDDNPFTPVEVFNDIGGDDAFLVRNLKGSPLKRIPEWKFTAWSSYDWMFDAGVLTAGATWSYTGEYFSSGIERDFDEVPSRERVDAYVSWRDARDRWNVRAFVDNVFDEIGIREIGSGTASVDWEQDARALYPRFYGIDLTFRMGG